MSSTKRDEEFHTLRWRFAPPLPSPLPPLPPVWRLSAHGLSEVKIQVWSGSGDEEIDDAFFAALTICIDVMGVLTSSHDEGVV